MPDRLLNFWESCQSKLWFIPMALVLLGVFLSLVTLRLDAEVLHAQQVQPLKWLFYGNPAGARLVLSTIAGSMMTIAGLVFSITLVVLSLASSQYGHIVVRNFVDRPINKVVFGMFIGTFIYALLIMRTVNETDPVFVPHFSISMAILMALVSLVALVYFLNAIVSSIQVDNLLQVISRDMTRALERSYPQEAVPESDDEAGVCQSIYQQAEEAFDNHAVPIPSTKSGYLQAIEYEVLTDVATEFQGVLRLSVNPGKHLTLDTPVAEFSKTPENEEHQNTLIRRVNNALVSGNRRTYTQDVEYGIEQIVEIALRALSPGVNAPFTAITCIDRLTELLCKLAHQEAPLPYRADKEGNLRVIVRPTPFSDIMDTAFNQLRQFSGTIPSVSIRLLESIERICWHARRPEVRKALLTHADLVARHSLRGIDEDHDRQEIETRLKRIRNLLNADHPPIPAL